MKKSLMVVVALLAIAGLLAAMAFSTATVTSYANFSVTNTDEALLALIPSEEHSAAGLIAPHPSKSHKLNIDWGNVQSQSVYAWKDLFTVQNNSDNEIEVSIYADPSIDKGLAPDIYIGSEDLLYDGSNDYTFEWGVTGGYWHPWWGWVPTYGWVKVDVESEAEVITFILGPKGSPNDSKDISTILDSIKEGNEDTGWITNGDYSFNLMVTAERTDGQ